MLTFTVPFDRPVLWLVAGLLGVLVAATGAGRLVAARAVSAAARATARNLNARIAAWWAMCAVFGLALALGRGAVVLLFAAVSLLALREYLSLLPTRPADHRALAVAFYLLAPLQFGLLWAEQWAAFGLLVPVAAGCLLPVLAALRGDSGGFLGRAAALQWGLLLCVYNVAHAPALLSLSGGGHAGRGEGLLVFLIAVAQGSDVLQYVWGKLFGRRPIAPRVSPNKTVEGFAGGVLSATVLGGALWWLTPFEPPVAVGLALGVALLGFAGGLVASAVKRDRGVKDFGGLLPGHGGVLDRIDSLAFAAPAFFYAVRALLG